MFEKIKIEPAGPLTHTSLAWLLSKAANPPPPAYYKCAFMRLKAPLSAAGLDAR